MLSKHEEVWLRFAEAAMRQGAQSADQVKWFADTMLEQFKVTFPPGPKASPVRMKKDR